MTKNKKENSIEKNIQEGKIIALDFNNLKEEASLFEQTSDLHVVSNSGQVYNFKGNLKFAKTKKYELVEEFIAFLNEARFESSQLSLTSPYISLLIIKHFTDIDISDSIDAQVAQLKLLINLELLAPIVNALPLEEVKSVFEELENISNNVRANIQEAISEVQKLEDSIENTELLEKFQRDAHAYEKNKQAEVVDSPESDDLDG